MGDVESFAKSLEGKLKKDALSFDQGARLAYSVDNSRLWHMPDCVAWPCNEAEVVEIAKAANETKFPIHVRGRGTATTGSSLAQGGGAVVSTERLDRIIEIDSASRIATVEPGVITGDLAKKLGEAGLHWPPDPSSFPYCSIGGNIATAAAGPRGLRHGGVRENVLAARAVTGAGKVVTSGARVQKSSVGYDFARLLVGSEGTLAIITEATLRLFPLPGAELCSVASFDSVAGALEAVKRLMQSKASPSIAEFMDDGCLSLAGRGGLPKDAASVLMLAAEGADETAAMREMERTKDAVKSASLLSCEACDKNEPPWSMRKVLSQKLREVALHKINEDVSVPVGRLVGLVGMVRGLCNDKGIQNLNFGHAGAGNIHVNLLYDDDKDRDKAEEVVKQMMEWVVDVGGSISGEHGVGIAKRRFLPLQVDGESLVLMSRLKGCL